MNKQQETARPRTLPLVLLLVGLACITLFGAFKLGGVFEKKPNDIATCTTTKTIHTVIIQNNTVIPAHFDASQCDSLTIINKDDRTRILAFGQHEHHTAYNGVEERVLQKDQQLTVTLNQTGTFTFHDHEQDTVQGTFTINQ